MEILDVFIELLHVLVGFFGGVACLCCVFASFFKSLWQFAPVFVWFCRNVSCRNILITATCLLRKLLTVMAE